MTIKTKIKLDANSVPPPKKKEEEKEPKKDTLLKTQKQQQENTQLQIMKMKEIGSITKESIMLYINQLKI